MAPYKPEKEKWTLKDGVICIEAKATQPNAVR
jgi:hypothetical protein